MSKKTARRPARDRYYDANRNARIASRIDRTGKLRTETQGRDSDAVVMAVSTDQRSNSTNLYIDFPGREGDVRLTGREARSLFRLLANHYVAAGK